MTDDGSSPPPEPSLAEALRQACVRDGLDPGCVQFALQHLDAPDDDWRWCCGSNCDPCVQALGRLVDEGRRLRLGGIG